MHPGAVFLCAQMGCSKRFKTRNALELHRSTVGHAEAPFQIIGSDKKPFGGLASGAGGAGGGGGEFACAQCGRSFGTKSLLTRHAAVVHTTERPFPCGDCGRAFKSRTNWKVSKAQVSFTYLCLL